VWRPLTYDGIEAERRAGPILAIRADGKGYFGTVVDVNREYVELANGSQRQILRFFDSPTQFVVVKRPPFHQRKLAERTLRLEGYDDGR
jgi:hypothetical protein